MPTTAQRGDVVLVRFPFTDLTTAKLKPAVVLATHGDHLTILGAVPLPVTSPDPETKRGLTGNPKMYYQVCEWRCDIKPKPSPKTVRRSVALPRQLVEEAAAAAPGELRQNLNRLVTVALQEFAAHRKARTFEEAMAQMGADPAIRAECTVISRDFAIGEADGLKDD
jgi:hypothetical protein